MNDKKKTVEYFSSWQVQNKITLISLIAILLLSALFVAAAIILPAISTAQIIAFIILIPALACFGIATCHSSSLELEKARRDYDKMAQRLSETEDSQITLDRFFSISNDLMAVAGKDGRLKKVSKSLVNTLGYSEEVLLSTPFFDFIHPEDRASTRENIKALSLGLRSVDFVNRYQTAQGSYRTLSWSAVADDELGVRFASARDVTDERNFRTRMQQILDSAPFLLIVKDTEGVITNCNDAFAGLVGFTRESLLGKNVRLLTSPLHSAPPEKEQEVLRSRIPVTFDEVFASKGAEEKYLSTVFPILDQTGKIISIGKVSVKVL
ncbi:PAS domain-containing protein [Bdellovibrio bacteriovorus]|uniref:PAS domain-containing protein n=1 Tax=Bdellovibrio bacteriovorus TaxID=959 RepID=UPI001D051D8A|nr:PAS domain-containing protein [Bdellovibrio bacteriovorus]